MLNSNPFNESEQTTRRTPRPFRLAAALTFLCLTTFPSRPARAQALFAQQTPAQALAPADSAERERGIELYQQGDAKGAVKVLRDAVKQHQQDAEAWHFLGLALKGTGKMKDARKALERAVNLRISFYQREFSASGREDPLTGKEERAVHRAQVAARLREAAESVEQYLGTQPKEAALWGEMLETLRFYGNIYTRPAEELDAGRPAFGATSVTTRAVLLSKPEPEYTDAARQNSTRGAIRLRLILSDDGTVKHILPLRSLPDGLTEKAIKAARQIKFKPATKDGVPVSQFVMVEYNFNIY